MIEYFPVFEANYISKLIVVTIPNTDRGAHLLEYMQPASIKSIGRIHLHY